MALLGNPPRFCDRARPWAGWQSQPGPRSLLLIGMPYDRIAHATGNGQMVAFLTASRALVDRAHALALAHGGTSEGTPRLRPEYTRIITGHTSGTRTATNCASPAMRQSRFH